ncbi:MAG: hypothetical protein ABJN02_17335 [Lentilitoribacter sp.]
MLSYGIVFFKTSQHTMCETNSGRFGPGYDEGVDPTVTDCHIPEEMVRLGEGYQQTRKRLAEYKVRLAEATERSDGFNTIQREAERSNALIALPKLVDIATEGALKCGGRMGKVATSFGGELIASHRNANLIAQHVGSAGFNDMKRMMQAIRHRVPVDVIEGGNLEASLQYGNHSSTLQHSGLLLDRLMEDIVSGRVYLYTGRQHVRFGV